MQEDLQYGGYVDPPSYLKRGKDGPDFTPAAVRTVPDYDYSLFRYSKLALPFLALIGLTAAVLAGLTFWQGPWGIRRGVRGLQDGTPREILPDDFDAESGMVKELRSLRVAVFIIGVFPLLFLVFAIRAELTPGPLKAIFAISILFLLAVFVLAWIAFAIGIDQVHRIRECEWPSVPATHFSPRPICTHPEDVAIAAVTSDALLALAAILLIVALVFSGLMSKNYAWGPGRVSVKKSQMQPRMKYPPPSPFTKIHETRRAYVWILILAFALFLTLNFILAMLIHEMRQRPYIGDARNNQAATGLNGEREISGWPVDNNRLRISISVIVLILVLIQLFDYAGPKRRFLAYTIAVLLFFAAVGCFILFGLDVAQVNKADDLPCPNFLVTLPTHSDTEPLKTVSTYCREWQFRGTVFVDFMLAVFILFYVIYEFLYRCNATMDTFYFFADSEWLRTHSLFVEQTDREAYDWREFTMETGRKYYYSPTLGISTRVRPANYIDADVPLPYAGSTLGM